MMTNSLNVAWEAIVGLVAEGLQLLKCAPPAVRAELKAAVERIELPARARNAPGFDRCASLVCASLGAPELCAVTTCSRDMKLVARQDHLWRTLTAQRFSSGAEDLRRAGSTLAGFREYARLVRLWNHPDLASRPPGMDAYSVVLEIKIGGQRIAGGVYELETIRNSRYARQGFAFYDLDPQGLLSPTPLSAWDFGDDLVDRMTISMCVLRKSDKKCLHLVTDIGADHRGEDCVWFADGSRSCFGRDERVHDFVIYGANWEAPADGGGWEASADTGHSILRGFDNAVGELRLWCYGHGPTEASSTSQILDHWHESNNWV